MLVNNLYKKAISMLKKRILNSLISGWIYALIIFIIGVIGGNNDIFDIIVLAMLVGLPLSIFFFWRNGIIDKKK